MKKPMQAMILESGMRDTSKWGGKIGMKLGTKLYLDMSEMDLWTEDRMDGYVKSDLCHS